MSLEDVLANTAVVIAELDAAHTELAQHAERIEAELARKVEELDRAHAHLAAVLSALPTGVIVRDADGVVRTTNQAACSLLGENNESLEGSARVRGLEGAPSGDVVRISRADATTRDVVVREAEVLDADGNSIGRVQTLDDRTELVAAERRLNQQSKLAALGTLAGGIAHEIRNPMNAIRGFGSLMAQELASDERLGRWSSMIVEGADEVEEIVAATMRLARTGQLTCETVPAQSILDEALSIARATRTDAGAWTLECAPTDLTLEAEPVELRQALRNLLVNAMDAQPEGGTVRVSTSREGSTIVFTVEDAGPGIAPELAERIREPFFTTRAEGTGLGLALVHSIAELHGGSLELDADRSELGGACFRLILPTRS